MFDLTSSMNFFESSPLISYLWSNFKMLCWWMCISNVKANHRRLDVLSHSKRCSNTCIRRGKFSSFLFYFSIFPFHYYLRTLFIFFCSLVIFFMQCKISIARNVTIKLYYKEFTKGAEHSPIKLKEWKERAME